MFFKPPSSAHFLKDFALVPPLKNFKKWPILVSLLNWLELDFAGSFGGAICVKMFSDDCSFSTYQLRDRRCCAGVFFKPPRSAHFLKDFALVPPLKNFKKWPILVSLLNWPVLDFAGSFGSAVCVKMLSDDCTFSVYQLRDRRDCAGVFLKPPSSAHFLKDFALVPPLKNFKKWPILVSLLNWLELDFAGSFGGAVCVKMFSDNCTLRALSIPRSPGLRGSVFQAAEVGPLFEGFCLGPPFEEFQKMADFGVFAKLARTRLCGQLWRRDLRQNVLR